MQTGVLLHSNHDAYGVNKETCLAGDGKNYLPGDKVPIGRTQIMCFLSRITYRLEINQSLCPALNLKYFTDIRTMTDILNFTAFWLTMK